jgi:hypothetical protein
MTLRRSLFWFALGFISICVWVVFAYGHGGGLDAHGCHNNRKAGGYHCHQGQFAGQSFSSQQEMLQRAKQGASGLKETPPAQKFIGSETPAGTTPSGKTIYVGPRGGRYHYSASGKKVYERRR